MKRQVLSLLILAGLAGLSLTGLSCEPNPKQELMLRAPALVTKGGLPDTGRLVTFATDKYYDNGVMDSGSHLTSEKFTDFLGFTEFLFGYNLEYNPENEVFTGYARVIGSVEYNGTTYADTVWMPKGSVSTAHQEHRLDTLRIDLPAKQQARTGEVRRQKSE